ncbi:serine/threonine protein kinase [Erwinia sp. S43]|uniref:serine/threonine protein kinase n=1 Tax=unclassified Erwinia TaxID=2622719 RepID=UPI00190C08C0|nr:MULTISPECIES: serine/threonine-protein kinase [unclassified Erwinia]MBK0030654.1 serine/threonine protein kinase [Erwinia sp. S43]MCW1874854.1 serine/threonine protein kinase [Erwinia sp. INIA01]
MSANEQQQNATKALPPGYRFNEFEIQEVIGGGGFGIVYRAWDHLLERTIAIKEFMPNSLATRSEDLSVMLRAERHQRLFNAGMNSFVQEARLLARFNHPGLLHVLRFWEGNGTAYMGTLFYSGMTLKAWQSSQPQTINEALIRQLLPPLFGAINTIHRAGFLHRDISLDNIQIQENQLPVLLDFGSARKEIGNLSDETEIMLKPGFAPLEQYCEESDAEQGPWTDIYALGAVLHTLIIGTPPPVSVVRSIEDSYQPLSDLRPEGYSLPLLNAIDRSLMMDATQRPQSIDELASLINLPVTDVEDLLSTIGEPPVSPTAQPEADPAPATETEAPVAAINPAASAAEPLIAAKRPLRLSKPLLLLSALAVLAVGTVVWMLNRTPQSDVAQPVNEVSPTAPVADATAAAADAPALATVYLKLSNGDTLLLNNNAMTVTPNNSGYAVLNLAAGDYLLQVHSTQGDYSQQLKIDRAGTWLINPAH